MKAQQGKDLEEPLDLGQVSISDGLIQTLLHQGFQLLLSLLQESQAGIHRTA